MAKTTRDEKGGIFLQGSVPSVTLCFITPKV